MPLVLTVLTALPQISTGVSHLISWVSEMRKVGQQDGSWTDEEEKLFIAELERRATDPAYQPDPK